MTALEYRQYLDSPWWAHVSAYMKRRANYRCERCGWKDVGQMDGRCIEVHHLSYARLGNEYVQDMIVLCTGCHQRTHGRELEDRYGVGEGLGDWESVGEILPEVLVGIPSAGFEKIGPPVERVRSR